MHALHGNRCSNKSSGLLLVTHRSMRDNGIGDRSITTSTSQELSLSKLNNGSDLNALTNRAQFKLCIGGQAAGSL